MDFDAFKAKYFRFWDVEDRPGDVTFDKYQRAVFPREAFRRPGRRRPVEPRLPGRKLGLLRLGRRHLPGGGGGARPGVPRRRGSARRRFYFDNYFKRVLHRPTGDPLQPTGDDRRRGYRRSSSATRCGTSSPMTRPIRSERADRLRAEAFAGEYEPVTLGLVPLRDLGKVAVAVTDLTGPGGGSRRKRSTWASSHIGSAASRRRGASTRSARD